MVPCIELNLLSGQKYNQPVADIRHIQEESAWVEVINISTRQSTRVSDDFNTIVSKSAFDLVAFTDANANGRNTAINRAYVRRVMELANGQAIIVIVTGQSFYPVEDFATLSPFFERFSGGAGGGGIITDLSNVGGGTGIYKPPLNGSIAELKTLIDSATVTIEEVGTETIRFNATAASQQLLRSTFFVSGLQMAVEHIGGAFPGGSFALIGDGDFRLTLPTGFRIIGGLYIEGNDSNVNSTSGHLTFRINDTDGHLYRLNPTIWRRDTNQESDHLAFGVVPSYSDLGSERTYVFQNANKYGAPGFSIVCAVI